MSGSNQYERIPEAEPSGGFKFVDTAEEVAAERGLMWDLFKQIATNVTQRKNIINISLPVRLFEPRSYLERISDSWCLAPTFLTKAAKTSDPVERLKLVITFALGGLHNTCTKKKPFNPILGETFEGQYADGTRVYCEQTSHHPPITSWQVFGPNGLYHFYGYGEWTASFHVNSVSGAQKGLHYVTFPDGGKITYVLPEICVKGILWGDRVMEYLGTVRFYDHQNGLEATLSIPPPSAGLIASWWGGEPTLPSDCFKGTLHRVGPKDSNGAPTRGEVLSNVAGSWLGSVQFDGKPYFSVLSAGPARDKVVPMAEPLPSDCRFRKDLTALMAGKLDEAQEWKSKLEDLQRNDAKLRKAAALARGDAPHP